MVSYCNWWSYCALACPNSYWNWANLCFSAISSSWNEDFCFSHDWNFIWVFLSLLETSWELVADSAARNLATSISFRSTTISTSSLRTFALVRSTWELDLHKAFSISEIVFIVFSSSVLSSALSLLNRRATCITFWFAYSVHSWSWFWSSWTHGTSFKIISSYLRVSTILGACRVVSLHNYYWVPHYCSI